MPDPNGDRLLTAFRDLAPDNVRARPSVDDLQQRSRRRHRAIRIRISVGVGLAALVVLAGVTVGLTRGQSTTTRIGTQPTPPAAVTTVPAPVTSTTPTTQRPADGAPRPSGAVHQRNTQASKAFAAQITTRLPDLLAGYSLVASSEAYARRLDVPHHLQATFDGPGGTHLNATYSYSPTPRLDSVAAVGGAFITTGLRPGVTAADYTAGDGTYTLGVTKKTGTGYVILEISTSANVHATRNDLLLPAELLLADRH